MGIIIKEGTVLFLLEVICARNCAGTVRRKIKLCSQRREKKIQYMAD